MPESAVKSETARVQPLPAAERPATITVQEALTAIRQDSRSAPEIYLDDTAVPHGGE